MAMPGLRERKKTETARALGDAALALFCERGFDATTVEDIAAACDVSPRTFFRYFPVKGDVLFVETDERLAALVAAVLARPAGESGLRALRGAFLDVGFEGVRERILARNKVIEASPRLRSRLTERQVDWEDALAGALHRRLGQDGGDPLRELLVVGAATTAVRMAIRVWVAGDGTEDLAVLVATAFDQFEAGF